MNNILSDYLTLPVEELAEMAGFQPEDFLGRNLAELEAHLKLCDADDLLLGDSALVSSPVDKKTLAPSAGDSALVSSPVDEGTMAAAGEPRPTSDSPAAESDIHKTQRLDDQADRTDTADAWSTLPPDDAGNARRPAAMEKPASRFLYPIENIEIAQLLGSGKFGCVYSASLRSTGENLAVKVIPQKRGRDASTMAANEAMNGAKLSHRNIIKIHALQPAGAYWIILMELVTGTPLSNESLAGENSRLTFGVLSDAIIHMATAHIVHRDLKPSNIIVRHPDRSPVIVDLGMSVDLSLRRPSDVGLGGTPFYMPPEAFDGVITPAFDAYSLGVTAAAVVGGIQHWSGSGTTENLIEAKKAGSFQDQLLTHLLDVDDDLKRWIERLTSSEPGTRLQALDVSQKWSQARRPWWRFW